jgi:hypothetical protein
MRGAVIELMYHRSGRIKFSIIVYRLPRTIWCMAVTMLVSKLVCRKAKVEKSNSQEDLE